MQQMNKKTKCKSYVRMLVVTFPTQKHVGAPMIKKTLLILFIIFSTLALGACGSSSSGGGTPPGGGVPPAAGDVALVHAALTTALADDVVAKLSASSNIASVTAIDASAATPTLADLQAYDAIIIMSDNPFFDSTALGDNVADYVDSCGGVVQTMFAYNWSPLAGRFGTDNYFVIASGTGQTSASQETLGTVNYPDHPTMAGVASFDGGTSSFRPSAATLVTGGTMIATWSDGMPLVTTRTLSNGAKRVDLGFFPPSSDSRSDLWDSTTDGVKLMTNALEWVATQNCVGIAMGDNGGTLLADMVKHTTASGRFDLVGQYQISGVTMSLADLQKYDSVLVGASTAPVDPVAMGDNLADYVDVGGGVVIMPGANTPSFGITGRFDSGGYFLATPTDLNSGATRNLGTINNAAHEIMDGVGSATVGLTLTPLTIVAGNSIADWDSGTTAVVAGTVNGTRRAMLNFFSPSDQANASGWSVGTDADLLMVNALDWTANRAAGMTDYRSADPGLPIAIVDDTTFTSSLDITGAPASISEIKVHMDISHTWDNDLDIRIIAPDGITAAWLTSDNGGSSDNYTGVTYADDAGTGVVDGTAPFTGQFIPEEALAVFSGMNANGTWTLEVTDDLGGDVGTLNKWSISVR